MVTALHRQGAQEAFMIEHAAELRRLDVIIWAIIAAVAMFVGIIAVASDFHIVVYSFAAPIVTGGLLIAGARYYRGRRKDLNLASALESTAQLAAFAAVAAPLSYLAASVGLPLQDIAFDAADRALGFDWNKMLAIMYHWPTFFESMRVIYLSLTVQMTAVVLLLGFSGRLSRLRVYMLAFIFAALLTIALSALLPAQGVWLHYGLQANPAAMPVSHTSWPVFLGLRDGTYRLLMAVGSEGIITFPSLHAALAVLLIAAFWPVPIARWVGLVVNSLMLAATPIDGSHYLVDVFAGIAIAILAWACARMFVRRMTAVPAATTRPNLTTDTAGITVPYQ